MAIRKSFVCSANASPPSPAKRFTFHPTRDSSMCSIMRLANAWQTEAPPMRFISGQQSVHKNVAELPRVRGVDVFWKEARPIDQRRPVGVDADDRTEIGHL